MNMQMESDNTTHYWLYIHTTMQGKRELRMSATISYCYCIPLYSSWTWTMLLLLHLPHGKKPPKMKMKKETCFLSYNLKNRSHNCSVVMIININTNITIFTES